MIMVPAWWSELDDRLELVGRGEQLEVWASCAMLAPGSSADRSSGCTWMYGAGAPLAAMIVAVTSSPRAASAAPGPVSRSIPSGSRSGASGGMMAGSPASPAAHAGGVVLAVSGGGRRAGAGAWARGGFGAGWEVGPRVWHG